MSANDKIKLNYSNIAYGTCSTEAATAAKVITISGNTKWALTAGSIICIKFSVTNTAQNPTFNVNGTGAKSVWYNTALITTGSLGMAGTANRPMVFMYDGIQYVFIGWSIDANSTNYLPLTGGTVTGDITIKKTSTIANNYPATLNFTTVQSDNSITTSSAASIKVYDDHDATTYGTNMVIQSAGNMIIGSGESPNACYTTDLKDNTSENMYITSDGSIYFYTNCNTYADKKSSVYINTSGALYGAVWNDYAEFRELKENIEIPYGRVVIENGDDTLSLSTKRLQGGGNICSDTFGFAIGETEKAKMPIAVSGRALVYPYEDRNSYEPGDAVCTGPEGTVSKMTREEIKEYPDRIIGYVSAIPNYEIWGENNVAVNNRIWVRIL